MKHAVMHSNRKRHFLAGTVLLLSLTMLLAACSAGTVKKSASTRQHGNVASGGASGVFSVAQAAPINNLIPQPYNQSNMAWDKAIFNTLTGLGPKGTATPELATQWSWNSSYTVLTLNIRPDVRYQDGTLLTTTSIVNNLVWDGTPAHDASQGGLLTDATYTKTASTVTISLPNPEPQLLSALSFMPIMQLSSNLATDPIGTGPFEVHSFAANSELVLTRNSGYWDTKELPKVKEYVIRVFTDPQSAIVALESGQVDALAYPSLTEVSQLKSHGMKIVSEPAGGIYQIQVNVDSGPLENPDVRKALSLAFDRQEFSDLELKGLGSPTCEIWPNTSVAYDASLNNNCGYNLAKAKSLLVAAGYPNGFSTTLTESSDRTPTEASFTPIYQADLLKIGIKLSIDNVSPTVWQTEFLGASYPGLFLNFYGFENVSPSILFSVPPFNPQKNASNFRSASYSSLVSKAETTTNSRDSISDFQAIARYVENANFIIPIATRPYIYAVSHDVHGFAVNTVGMAVVSNVSV